MRDVFGERGAPLAAEGGDPGGEDVVVEGGEGAGGGYDAGEEHGGVRGVEEGILGGGEDEGAFDPEGGDEVHVLRGRGEGFEGVRSWGCIRYVVREAGVGEGDGDGAVYVEDARELGAALGRKRLGEVVEHIGEEVLVCHRRIEFEGCK